MCDRFASVSSSCVLCKLFEIRRLISVRPKMVETTHIRKLKLALLAWDTVLYLAVCQELGTRVGLTQLCTNIGN